ncbi:hypothetical protein POVCU2_0092440 [Plasmodium ovale curtisi]|uniref:PIR Superfamily Protein n=1 Tax=Plasmodium ovale curtisi TaxID=864141 RepID=A0A1A8WUK8_PLAOA|nr:hypothetical protein POVCU2_0092440 [Plasmodium ovale curtisi]
MIQGSINNFINSSLESNDCDLFSRSKNDEDVAIDLLNTSSKFKEINDYIKDSSSEIEVIYKANPDKYFDLLIYNRHTYFNEINGTIYIIKCLSVENPLGAEAQDVLSENPHTTPSHTTISFSFTLVVFVLISFLLYRVNQNY